VRRAVPPDTTETTPDRQSTALPKVSNSTAGMARLVEGATWSLMPPRLSGSLTARSPRRKHPCQPVLSDQRYATEASDRVDKPLDLTDMVAAAAHHGVGVLPRHQPDHRTLAALAGRPEDDLRRREPMDRAQPSLPQEQTIMSSNPLTVAVVGAGGKMGMRVSDNLQRTNTPFTTARAPPPGRIAQEQRAAT
jgi:hypothetical protein